MITRRVNWGDVAPYIAFAMFLFVTVAFPVFLGK